jgi:hypothetical protein
MAETVATSSLGCGAVPLLTPKNWYRKGTDLWAEFGNEMPFGRKNLLRGFGKNACDQQYAIIRQKDCLRF